MATRLLAFSFARLAACCASARSVLSFVGWPSQLRHSSFEEGAEMLNAKVLIFYILFLCVGIWKLVARVARVPIFPHRF